MAVKGSCVCGQTTYEFTGEYAAFIACHCIPCRKVSGADRSLNLLISRAAVTIAPGSPEKHTSRPAESGGTATYQQCGNCGNTLWTAVSSNPDIVFLKPGLIDDREFLDGLEPPTVEAFCRNMWKWEKSFESAKALQAQ